jgi:hypothetical protein
MPNPFGGPPDNEDGWAKADAMLRESDEYLEHQRAGPHGYVLGHNRLKPTPFGDWLEGLPESWENIEDRRDPNYKPPDRGHTISQSIGEWPEYKEPEQSLDKQVAKTAKRLTRTEQALVDRRIEEVVKAFSGYGRR